MRLNVRSKLILLVVLCILPAVFAAIGRTQQAYRDLVQQVSSRMEQSDSAFVADVHEDVEGTERTLKVAGADPRLISDLERDDDPDARRILASLGSGMDDAAFVLADHEGHLVGASTGLGAQLDSQANLRELQPVLNGATDNVLLPLTVRGGRVYALVVAQPVMGDGAQLGTLVMARPVNADFLAHLKIQLGSDWALFVNGELVAESPGHPAPRLRAETRQAVVMGHADGRTFALDTFQPPIFQRPGQVADVTASQDVTDLEASIYRQRDVSLAILGGGLLLALGIALLVGNRMVTAIDRVARAAASLRTGRYELVEGVRTHDELQQLAEGFNQAVIGLRERDQLKDAFGKYANRHVVELVTQGKKIELGGETVPVTVFFADIRGFTSISEKMDPKALLDFLNLYFSAMVDCVITQGGAVDKFIGDAIMAVFGAPVPQPDDALRAVRAALAMRERLRELNVIFSKRGLPEIRIGLGIHSGTVVAGHMGHSERLEYTVIGDPVNVASRLESMTKDLHVDVLLSEDTFDKVKDFVDAEALQKVPVRGRTQEISVYRLIALKPSAQQPKPASAAA